MKGISLFVVPKIRVRDDGSLGEPNDVVCVGVEQKLGLHGSPTCVLNFGENDDCIGYLCGEESEGSTACKAVASAAGSLDRMNPVLAAATKTRFQAT